MTSVVMRLGVVHEQVADEVVLLVSGVRNKVRTVFLVLVMVVALMGIPRWGLSIALTVFLANINVILGFSMSFLNRSMRIVLTRSGQLCVDIGLTRTLVSGLRLLCYWSWTAVIKVLVMTGATMTKVIGIGFD